MAEITMIYVGGPTVLIEAGGWRILTDPTFDQPGGGVSFGLGTYSRKLQGPAVSFESLEPIDAVLISHDQHLDNLDLSGRERLPQMGQIVTTASGAERLGLGARGLTPGQSMVLEAPGTRSIEITATPCRHGPPGSHPIVGVCRKLDPETIVPIHTEGWRHFSQPRDEAVDVLNASGYSARVTWLTAGQPTRLEV